jgi:hypothetical protein
VNPENINEILCGMCVYTCEHLGITPPQIEQCTINGDGDPGCLYREECSEFIPAFDCEEDFFEGDEHYGLRCQIS